MAHFKTQARVLDLLGEQQIANCPTALSELFKNAHDAYARRAVMDVYPDSNRVVISDDGYGMSEDDLLSRWLVVGTPTKKTVDRAASPPPGFVGRPIQGEKGIGRLAISTVGDSLLLVSKARNHPNSKDSFSALFLNWNIARNLNLMLSDIEIPTISFGSLEELESSIVQDMVNSFRQSLLRLPKAVWTGTDNDALRGLIFSQLDDFSFDLDYLKRSCISLGEGGTAFCIQHLKHDIAQLVRPPHRIDDDSGGSLNAELVQLLSNFRNKFAHSAEHTPSYEFDVDVRRWVSGDHFDSVFTDWQAFDEDDLRYYDHKIDVSFDKWGRFSGSLEIFRKSVALVPVDQQARRQLPCGPFSLHVWYYQGLRAESTLEDEQFSLINKKLDRFGGIMVYRDDLRVLPYGRPEYDWLKFEERRSRNAGRYFFSYRRMFGFVRISDRENSELRDKSGREGLIENAAYRHLRQRLIDFFNDLATAHFYQNESFEETVLELKGAREAVADQRKRAAERRDDLKKSLSSALTTIVSSMELPGRLAESTLDELARLPDMAAGDLVSFLLLFRQRLARVEGPTRVHIPARMSLGRDRTLKQLVADFRVKKAEFDAICVEANRRIDDEIRRKYPKANDDASRQKMLRDRRFQLTATVGKQFSLLRDEVGGLLRTFEEQLDTFRAEQILRIDNAILAAGVGTTLEEVLRSDNTDPARVLYMMEAAERDALEAITEKGVELRQQLEDLLSGNREALVAAQTDAIEQLTENVNMNLELVQLGLAVEIIDHELNKLYRGTKAALKRLATMTQRSPPAAKAVDQVRVNFYHLEQRYKLMSPLYRGSYDSKRQVTGRMIARYVNDFVGDAMAANAVELVITDEARDFTISESEAVVYPVFVNVVDNSTYWLRNSADRRIQFDVVDGVFTVSDTGPGISDAFVDSIFDAFFSTKPNGRGLGLYVARANLRRHGHEIWATNDPRFRTLAGACICIRFSKDCIVGGPLRDQ